MYLSSTGNQIVSKLCGGGLAVQLGTIADGRLIMSFVSLAAKLKNWPISLLHGLNRSESR